VGLRVSETRRVSDTVRTLQFRAPGVGEDSGWNPSGIQGSFWKTVTMFMHCLNTRSTCKVQTKTGKAGESTASEGVRHSAGSGGDPTSFHMPQRGLHPRKDASPRDSGSRDPLVLPWHTFPVIL